MAETHKLVQALFLYWSEYPSVFDDDDDSSTSKLTTTNKTSNFGTWSILHYSLQGHYKSFKKLVQLNKKARATATDMLSLFDLSNSICSCSICCSHCWSAKWQQILSVTSYHIAEVVLLVHLLATCYLPTVLLHQAMAYLTTTTTIQSPQTHTVEKSGGHDSEKFQRTGST